MKQISINIIGYIFPSWSKSAASLQPGRFRGSDRLGSCWRRSIFLVFFFVEYNRVFNWSLHRKIVKSSWRKGGVYAWSEHCVHIQLWIFPVEFYVFENGYLIAASVQVLSPYTGEYFVCHLYCSLLVPSDWHSWQIIIQEILLLRQQ